MRIAVVPARGLGDALIMMVLSHNLLQAGHEVVTFSSALTPLASWFPDHTIRPFPNTFTGFDKVLAQDHTPPLEGALVFKESRLDKSVPYVINMARLSTQYGVNTPTLDTGITPPSNLTFRKHFRRVLIHPLSTEHKRAWTQSKTEKLAAELTKRGWMPKICLANEEREGWDHFLAPEHTLPELAAYIYESHGLIGVDSGLGHLASALGLPTLSLFARKSYARLKRPGWGVNTVISAPPLLIGSMLKQKYWKHWLSPRLIAQCYEQRTHLATPSNLQESPQDPPAERNQAL